jgi:hypothetical protein
VNRNPFRIRSAAVVLAVALLAWITACAAPRRIPLPAGGGAGPARSPESAVKACLSRAGSLRAGKAFARIRGTYRRDRFSARASVLMQKPGDLYLEVNGPFGRVGLKLWLVADTLTVLWPREKEFLSEPATPEAAEQLFGLGLHPEEIVSLFLGEGIPPGRFRPAEADAVSGGGTVRAVLRSEELNRRAVLLIDREPPRVLEGALQTPAETPLASFRYEYAGRSELPQRIELQSPAGDLRIRLTYEYFHREGRIRSSSFRVKLPGGVRRVERGDLRVEGPILFSSFKE